MAKGDIVLISFPLADLSGSKLRPAVVLAVSPLDITVCFITSQIKWAEHTDMHLSPSPVTGIKTQSLVRLSKIATIDKGLAMGRLGSFDKTQISELDVKLKALLHLP